jgi:hypothetical protein
MQPKLIFDSQVPITFTKVWITSTLIDYEDGEEYPDLTIQYPPMVPMEEVEERTETPPTKSTKSSQ